ncbi:MAG: pyruvate dehydrogenase [Acidobacteria bacterium]|nr:pyruvate dehydrogenase [Acidobacteriota bacterium]
MTPVKRVVERETPFVESVERQDWGSAFLIRAFEQKLLRLFSEGQLFGTVHTCIGQELTGVAIARCLQPEDVIFSNHRCHGHYLARTGDVEGLLAEIMGRQSGICGGRGGSQHLCAQGFFSNGIQGGIVPVASGLAMAQKLRQEDGIAVVFIGDGTLGEGAVYEAFNIAAKWQLPLAIVLENNLYAQSTSQSQTLAGDIGLRAEAFGIRAFQADTWATESLFQTAGKALGYVRQTSQPAFLSIDTYRLMAHSKGDDERNPEEVQRYWSLDPLTRFAREFSEEANDFQKAAEQQISEALARAKAAPFATVEVSASVCDLETLWQPTKIAVRDRLANRIYSALGDNMERDERIICIGEDIEAPYGGAFKVTKDLSQRFPGRVRNTPISESAIVGLANGLAMAGYRPVVEIMFGDFLTLAADQIINHAAKFRYMYNEQVSIPVIIRTPMGGKRGYGPTHSQCLEKHFFGIPDTRVLALHHRYDPARIYDRLFATLDCPALVIENKILYGEFISEDAPEGFVWENTDGDFPTSRLRPHATPDVTIVCYGGMLLDVERAVDRLFEDHEIVAEVICPVELYPLRIAPILASVESSRRLVVVEEGQLFSGFGAELLAAIHERAPGLLTMAKRLGPPPSPNPAAKPAELKMLPTTDSIISSIVEVICG